MPEKKYYLAGPMTGYPQHNFPAFYEAAESLREMGYEIISPAELDDPEVVKKVMATAKGGNTETWESYMDLYVGGTPGVVLARDVKLIIDDVDGVILMDNWEKSRGARLEAYIALVCDRTFLRYTNGEALKLSTTLVSRIVADQLLKG